MPCCTEKNKGDTVKETLHKARLTALHAICVQITHKLYSVFPK